MRVLMTGSEGVIGTSLRLVLGRGGHDIVPIDLKPGTSGGSCDMRDHPAFLQRLEGCSGIVHLAAVSRVAWGERDPHRCFSCNVDGTRAVIRAALSMPRPPWLLFVSSREVYGNAAHLPATECTPIAPVNVYGRSKAMGESLMCEAREAGLNVAVVRLSNVYGSSIDHPDRLIPTFVSAALEGRDIWLRGPERVFDFTHIADIVRALSQVIELLEGGAHLPVMQLASGAPVSLSELARLALSLTGSASRLRVSMAEGNAVTNFYGSYDRAHSILGWKPQIDLRAGMARLLSELSIRDAVCRMEVSDS